MSGPRAEDIVAAELLLQRLGVSAQDLPGRPVAASSAPTFAEYIPVVEASMRPSQTRDCYTSYWNQILTREDWRDRRIDEPTGPSFVLWSSSVWKCGESGRRIAVAGVRGGPLSRRCEDCIELPRMTG